MSICSISHLYVYLTEYNCTIEFFPVCNLQLLDLIAFIDVYNEIHDVVWQ